MTDIVPIPTAPEMPVGAPLLPVVSQPILGESIFFKFICDFHRPESGIRKDVFL